jgi:hypothetical protein
MNTAVAAVLVGCVVTVGTGFRLLVVKVAIRVCSIHSVLTRGDG